MKSTGVIGFDRYPALARGAKWESLVITKSASACDCAVGELVVVGVSGDDIELMPGDKRPKIIGLDRTSIVFPIGLN